MAILTISNGKYGNEYVVVKEGEVWQIDKYTMEYEDSSAIRTENLDLFQKFQSSYPFAGRGSVRLFLVNSSLDKRTEWLVFYKKHKTVFPQILSDSSFMEHYFDGGSRYLSFRDISNAENFPDRLAYYMLSICDNLKRRDQKAVGSIDGGPLYYGFLRDILYRYIDYSNRHKDVKTIDQLYVEYYKSIHDEPNFLFDKESDLFPSSTMLEEVSKLSISDSTVDPDEEIYSAMDNQEPRYSQLQAFLANPHFERHYGNIFEDSYLFILGNSIHDHEQQEAYEKWYQYAQDGFDGVIVCPNLSKETKYISHFEESSINFFCIFKIDAELERMIALSLANRSEVIICLYDASLYPRYAKSYPKAMIVLPNVVEPDKLLDQVDSFMIDCYNRVKEKRYQ